MYSSASSPSHSMVVLTPPAHLAAQQSHILTDLQPSVSKSTDIYRTPQGQTLVWVLSRRAASGVLWPSASPGQRLSDSWRVHKCFKLLKNCPGSGFLQQSPFEAGSEYHFQKRKNKKKIVNSPFHWLRNFSLTWKWKRKESNALFMWALPRNISFSTRFLHKDRSCVVFIYVS